MIAKTRSEAKELGDTFYFTGNPCKNGHIAERYVSNKTCRVCHRERLDKWNSENPDRSHVDLERKNKRNRLWKNLNPGLVKASRSKNRVAKMQRTPSWLTEEDENKIKEIYKTCPDGYHVDHIVPLQGKNVSGLHVPSNLQHLPAKENRIKKNSFVDFGEDLENNHDKNNLSNL